MEWNPRGKPAPLEPDGGCGSAATAATSERRGEERFSAGGDVKLSFDDLVHREITGSLLDYSRSGFRAAHGFPALRNGQVISFRHELAEGRARVIWNRILEARVETGFVVIEMAAESGAG